MELSILYLLKRLWSNVTKRRQSQFVLLFILMVVGSFSEVISIGAVLPFLAVLVAPEQIFNNVAFQPIIQYFGLTDPSQLLLPLTIVFGVAVIVANGMRLLLLWVSTRLSFATGADIGIGIYTRTLYQPYSFHCNQNSSEIITAIATKTDLVIYSVIMPVLLILNSFVLVIAIFSALLVVDALAALVTFGVLAFIYSAIIFLKRNELAKEGLLIARESTNRIKALQEGLGGIRDVLIDGHQATYIRKYRNSDLALRRAQGNNVFVAGAPRYFLESLGMVIIASLAFILVQGPNGVATAIPTLGALALGAQRLLPMIQTSYASWVNIQGGKSSVEDVLEFLEKPMPDNFGQYPTLPLPFNVDINLKKMFFRYNQNAPYVLKKIDLNIKKGSRVGFIGTTGSGKSTLLDIIMGLLEPSNGTIEIDGEILSSQNNLAWQSHIAHVPQDIFLSDSSIKENIAFGIDKEDIDFERVQLVASQAQISTTIEALSEKYQTIVGERGVKLSGGQRQRIGIARALYKKADIIIFDEATSALDDLTEKAVIDSINNLDENLTLLIIAHRLTTLKECTHIVKLDNGNIEKVGTYKDIMS